MPPTHLLEHGPEPAAKLADLGKGFLKNTRKGKEAECVTRGGSIEDDDGVFHRLDLPAQE